MAQGTQALVQAIPVRLSLRTKVIWGVAAPDTWLICDTYRKQAKLVQQ